MSFSRLDRWEPAQKRRYGTFLIIGAAVLLGSAGLTQAGIAVGRAHAVRAEEANVQQCKANIKGLGAATVVSSGDEIVATWNGVNGGMAELGSSSAAAMACPGWTMSHFCMGQECRKPGATLTVKRN